MKNLQQHFYLIVLFHLLLTGCGSYSSDEDKMDGSFRPVISSMSPSDAVLSVSIDTTNSVTFSEEMSSSSVTTNTSDTSCSGTLQLSSDNFSTCVQMSSSPTTSNSNKTFTVTPSSSLSYGTNYKLRLTNSIKDVSEKIISNQYTTPTGFTTEIYVTSTSPADSDSEVSVSTTISTTFSETMNTSSLTANTSGTSCSGTIQVSSDNFSTCVQMSSSPVASNSNKTFTVTPSSILSYTTTYKIRVTSGVQDSSGNGLSSKYETSSGFDTDTWEGTQQLGTSSGERGNDIVVDNSNNIYVTGHTMGGLDGNTNSGNSDIFLVKYNSSGTKQWSKQLGTLWGDMGYGVTVDSSDNIYVTGWTSGPLDGNTNSGSSDIFLLKYNSSGTKQWSKQLGTSSDDEGMDVTTDSSGNIYMTGYTGGDLDGNTNSGSYDMFLVKYNSSGTKQWSKLLGTSSGDYGYGVTTDSSDNIYVTGGTWEGLDGNTNSGALDIFLVKYNSSGTKQWTKLLGNTDKDYGKDVTTDSSDNIYVTGYTYLDLDGNTTSGGWDMFLVKYNSSGTKQWSKLLGTSSNDYGHGVTTDSSDNIYVTGETSGDLDGNTFYGATDIFLVKYNSSGTKQWTKQPGTRFDEQGFGVGVDSSDNIYVTGETSGGIKDGWVYSMGNNDMFLVKYNSDGVKQ
jgi:uncharacterized delta-60 repeat protein